MPFMFNDWAHVNKMLAARSAPTCIKSLESRQLKAFAFSTAGFRHVLNYKRAVAKPEDMTGLKIRTLDNPVHVAIMNAMGANATPMQYSEVATALRQRTVDGLDSPAPAAVTEKFLRNQQVPLAHRPCIHGRDLPDGHEALSGAAGGPAERHRRCGQDRRRYRNRSSTTSSTPNRLKF